MNTSPPKTPPIGFGIIMMIGGVLRGLVFISILNLSHKYIDIYLKAR
jgi:hypothetical protein